MRPVEGPVRIELDRVHSALLEAAEEVASVMNGGTGSLTVAAFLAEDAWKRIMALRRDP